jgi:hypothetical protein
MVRVTQRIAALLTASSCCVSAVTEASSSTSSSSSEDRAARIKQQLLKLGLTTCRGERASEVAFLTRR